MRVADYSKPTKDGSKKGTFVGDPSKTHIHIVKAETHIKVAGKRKDFDEGKPADIKKAITHLEDNGTAGTPGYDNCLAWLKAQ